MVEASLILDIVVLLAVVVIFLDRMRSKSTLDDRLDDLTEGLALMCNELLSRTEEIMKIKDYMPEFKIEQNPIHSIIELFKTMRGEKVGNQNITPRDLGTGRWSSEDDGQEENEETPTRETVDVID
tara:strand:- start:877 stop:1254 length:378 start_codon:yes stop_codon:yes gene_type:complete